VKVLYFRSSAVKILRRSILYGGFDIFRHINPQKVFGVLFVKGQRLKPHEEELIFVFENFTLERIDYSSLCGPFNF
jgi:hypothetical protein